MKIYTADQIKQADSFTIENEPITSLDLMERAAQALHDWFLNHINRARTVNIWCGPGNNGGDGLALARLLDASGYSAKVFIPEISSIYSKDFEKNLSRLDSTSVAVQKIEKPYSVQRLTRGEVVVDALFGSGLGRPITGDLAKLIEYLNWQEVIRVSIDIPAGMFSENNDHNTGAIFKAGYTLSLQFPKLSFMFAECNAYLGETFTLPIGISEDFILQEPSRYFLLDDLRVRQSIKPLKPYAHKGIQGHACIAAGSRGKMGAAILAGKSCLKSGVGLTTLHVPACGLNIAQTVIPEAMCLPDDEEKTLNYVYDYGNYNALGVGPGIGTDETVAHWLWNTLKLVKQPMVIDADALNILAVNPDWLELLPSGSILTPHLGEFTRLIGDFLPAKRLEEMSAFCRKYNVVMILKGKHSAIASPDGEITFNATGNPGMATGGTGDALTGLLTGLLAQGYLPKQAAIVGTYLHGLSGDLAAGAESTQGLTSGDLIEYIGEAWLALEK